MSRQDNPANENQVLDLGASVRDGLIDAHRRSSGDPGRFSCRQFDLPGGLRIYDIQIDPAIIERCPSHIAQDSNDDYYLTTMLKGRATINQSGEEFVLEPGGLALLAGGLPFSVAYLDPSRRLIVRIPRQVFRERLVNQDKDVNIGHLPSAGLGHVVNDLLKSVASEGERLAVTDQYTLGQSLLELTGALTRSTLKASEKRPESKRWNLLNRIFAYLDEHYMDSDLTPEKIAKANGISTRYLHSLFRESGTTVLRWVWERRLKAARNDLLDPSQADTSISEIAYRQGFNDTAHFSRSFRNRFGMSPSELRHRGATAH